MLMDTNRITLEGKDGLRYQFRYSRLIWLISALGLLALGGLLYVLLTEEVPSLFDIIGWVGVLVLLYPILSMPLSLELNGEELKLRRLLWVSRFSREEYEITEVSPLDLHACYRICGSGGYFGFSGLFWQANEGLFRLIQTQASTHYLEVRKRGGKRKLYIAIP